MEKTLEVLNELERQGIIGRYAIGGAIAATLYVEPFLTYDLDVFVSFPSDQLLISLSPLYDYLAAKGYKAEHEHIVIEGMPVQFLPVFNELIREAVAEAAEIKFRNTPTRIIGSEFLVAIMVQTGRRKDRERIEKMLDQALLDHQRLLDILRHHGLYERWRKISQEHSDER